MRTTITIDDELYRTVKERAAIVGRTVGQLIEDALRQSFKPAGGRDVRLPELPTDGGSGVLPGVDLQSNAALMEVMDAEEPVDALR